MTKYFCDQCHKEIMSSANRSEFEYQDLRIQVIVAVKGVWNGGHVCVDCIREVFQKGWRVKEADEILTARSI